MKQKPNNIIYIFIVLILCFSCSRKVYKIRDNKSSINQIFVSNSIECILTAYDLSEDASRISTKNDELILLVYSDTSNKQFPSLVYQDYFIIDSLLETKEFKLNNSMMVGSMLTFVLIEIDTKKNLKQIEPVVRSNLDRLFDVEHTGDIKSIVELLGDDDLLGIKSISLSDLEKKDLVLDFKGVHLFDSYKYRIVIKSTP